MSSGDFQQGALLTEIRFLQLQTLRELKGLRRAMKRKEDIPRAETWLKGFLSIAAPLATLWATGSFTKAIEVLAIVAGR